MSEYLQGLLTEAAGAVPAIGRLLQQGPVGIQAYSRSLTDTVAEPYQPRYEVADVASRYCARLLGADIAEQLHQELVQQPLVLTANHHGVDYFAQSVQGSLCLALRQRDRLSARTVPVFACGSVAMNNLTYPRGIMLYQTGSDISPQRLPVFPDRTKRQLVSRTGALNPEMLGRVKQRIAGLSAKKQISLTMAETVCQVLDEMYGDERVLSQAGYSDQAVLINQRLWQAMFPDGSAGQLVYLELEQVAPPLIMQDLADHDSLLSLLLFDHAVRSSLIRCLTGVKGCWHFAELFKQLYDQEQPFQSALNGTFMFWGVDDRSRRFALGVDRTGGQYVLRAIDPSIDWSRPLTSEALREALAEGVILPSLFTCYSVICLARGFICAGGYYQADYLPDIQRGVVSALSERAELKNVAEIIARAPTTAYLSGMQAVLCQHWRGLIPAGPMEIIASGGLTGADLEQVAEMSVIDAHTASLSETLMDVRGKDTHLCMQRLAREMTALKESQAVILNDSYR